MKKAILSPLCSAFVIPGMGQILNQQLKKGVLMLASVFLFLVIFIYYLYGLIDQVLRAGDLKSGDPVSLVMNTVSKDALPLRLMALAFALLWLYSIVDAFLEGRRQDRQDQ